MAHGPRKKRLDSGGNPDMEFLEGNLTTAVGMWYIGNVEGSSSWFDNNPKTRRLADLKLKDV